MTRMPWGKHRGQRLADIPVSYLTWVLTETDHIEPVLRRAIRAEVADRLGLGGASPPPPPWRSTALPAPPIAAAAVDIIVAGYRAVALRAHPDQGGTHDAMIAVTEARDWLRARVGAR